MRLLLDTRDSSFGGWRTTASSRKTAREIIANSRQRGTRQLSVGLGNRDQGSVRRRLEIELDDLEEAIAKNGFRPLPIGLRHAITAGRLPNVHRDPFDRMLVAQASVEELRLLTHDRVFDRYGLKDEGLPPIIV